MKRAIPFTAIVLLAGAATALSQQQPPLQGERPQPVDSARAQQDPERRVAPARKPMEPLVEERQTDTATKSFEQLDANKDGRLSKDELGAGKDASVDFSRLDRDGDGMVSRDEWNAYWSGRDDKH
ncbi:hypothetical protein [Tahibacter caeni]|uniref:hypothetical protein n=1 Tax=Tahibacter caeni TaxID=1453545 RepID=UPI002147A27C|nr:hypothetical protein [Tahibacter caeni]